MEILIIINEKSDLVYKQSFPSCQKLDKIFMDLLVVSYGSIDILNNLLKSTTANYLGCIDTFKDYKISALIYPSAYKCIFVHKQSKDIKKFMFDVYYLIKYMIIYEITDYSREIEGVEQNIINLYKKYYKLN